MILIVTQSLKIFFCTGGVPVAHHNSADQGERAWSQSERHTDPRGPDCLPNEGAHPPDLQRSEEVCSRVCLPSSGGVRGDLSRTPAGAGGEGVQYCGGDPREASRFPPSRKGEGSWSELRGLGKVKGRGVSQCFPKEGGED